MADNGLERLWEQRDRIRAEIVQLEARDVEVLREIRARQGVEGGAPGPGGRVGVMLADMEDPVSCMDVAGVIGKRSDNVARTLRNSNLMVVKCGQGYYCQAKDAAVLWVKFRKYWKEGRIHA